MSSKFEFPFSDRIALPFMSTCKNQREFDAAPALSRAWERQPMVRPNLPTEAFKAEFATQGFSSAERIILVPVLTPQEETAYLEDTLAFKKVMCTQKWLGDAQRVTSTTTYYHYHQYVVVGVLVLVVLLLRAVLVLLLGFLDCRWGNAHKLVRTGEVRTVRAVH